MGAAGAETTQANAIDETVCDLKAIKSQILADIEAKLSQKEESLWRRGQAELKKLHQEQKELSQHVTMLQDQQAALIMENQNMQGALLEVTSKFELVVKEMREVLRSLPQYTGNFSGVRTSPAPSVASTSASEAALRGEVVFMQTPISSRGGTDPGLHDIGCMEEAVLQLPTPWCTMPAASTALSCHDAAGLQSVDVAAAALSAVGPPPASWLAGGPTAVAAGRGAVLSLASALPENASQQASALLKPLHLAECLDQGLETMTIELVKEPGLTTLGIEVNQVNDVSLCVEGIDEHGLVGRYNLQQDAEASKVRIGDRIVEANGVRDDPMQMLEECKAQSRIFLTVVRDTGTYGSEGLKSQDDKERSAPTAIRLRPEAEVFVPSSHKEEATQ